MDKNLFMQFLILIISIGWSLLLFLGKRTLRSMDKKMEASFERIDKTGKDLQKVIAKRDAIRGREMRTFSLRAKRDLQMLQKKFEIQSDKEKDEMEKRIEQLSRAYTQTFISRQEFGAFTANMGHKIDSIYERLTIEGIKQ